MAVPAPVAVQQEEGRHLGLRSQPQYRSEGQLIGGRCEAGWSEARHLHPLTRVVGQQRAGLDLVEVGRPLGVVHVVDVGEADTSEHLVVRVDDQGDAVGVVLVGEALDGLGVLTLMLLPI